MDTQESPAPRKTASLMISYSRKDKDFVRKLYEGLLSRGFVREDIWVDWEGIPLSADWMAEITKGIQSSNAFIFVISPDSVKSEVCQKEIELAAESNKRFIPILYREPGKEVPLHKKVSAHNWVYIRDEQELEKTLPNLVKAINTDLEWLAQHTRFFNLAKEWAAKGRNDSDLVRGENLRDAENFIGLGATGKDPLPTPLHLEYVQAARRHAANLRRRNRFIAAGVGVALFILAVIASIQAVRATNNERAAIENLNVANTQQVRAEIGEAEAIAQRATAQANAVIAENNAAIAEENARASRALALASESIIQKNNDTQLALMLALLSIQETEQDDLVLPESKFALFSSLNVPNVLYTLPVHDDWVRSVAIDPTGTYLATGTSGLIDIWMVETGELVRTIEGGEIIRGLDFSPDGKRLGIASREWNGSEYDGIAWVVDVETGDEVFKLPGHRGFVNDIAFSADGNLIATAGAEGTIKLWFASSGSLRVTLFNNQFAVQALDFSPDSSLLVSGGSDNNAILWDVETGGTLLRTLRGHESTVRAVAFNPYGDRVITGSFDRDAIVWNVADGSKLQTLTGNHSAVLGVDYAPDGLSMLTASSGVKIWEYFYGTERFNLASHRGEVLSATYSSDGQYILTGSSDLTAKLWANYLKIDLLKMKQNVGRNLYAGYSHDGNWIVTTDEWGNILVHDALSGEVVEEWAVDDLKVESAAFDPQDSQRVVTGDENGQVLVWSRGNDTPVLAINAHTDEVNSVFFSPDGDRILSASDDGTVKVWKADNGDLLLSLVDEDEFAFYEARFNDDGDRIVTASQSGVAQIWDAASGEMVMELAGHTDYVNSAVFSHDSSKVYTASDDNTIRAWDAATGDQLQSLTGHTGFVYSIDLSPDGTLLVSGGADTTVKVWDLSNGREIYNYLGNNEDTNSVAFSPDGKSVLTASSDETSKEFAIDYDTLLAISQEYELRPLTPEECRRFLNRDDCTLTLFEQPSSSLEHPILAERQAKPAVAE